jgi:hypothetical protein
MPNIQPIALTDPAVLQAIKAEIAKPQYAAMTDQQICDALNAPIPIMGPDGKAQIVEQPPLYVSFILGVPFQPNAIAVTDLAAVRSA